jgi:hypothetical protein
MPDITLPLMSQSIIHQIIELTLAVRLGQLESFAIIEADVVGGGGSIVVVYPVGRRQTLGLAIP